MEDGEKRKRFKSILIFPLCMVQLKTVLTINIVFFSLIALLHLVRLILQWPAQIASWIIPVWLSAVGVIIAVVLAYVNGKQIQ